MSAPPHGVEASKGENVLPPSYDVSVEGSYAVHNGNYSQPQYYQAESQAYPPPGHQPYNYNYGSGPYGHQASYSGETYPYGQQNPHHPPIPQAQRPAPPIPSSVDMDHSALSGNLVLEVTNAPHSMPITDEEREHAQRIEMERILDEKLREAPHASKITRTHTRCTCYSGCDQEYHATLCKCTSLECQYIRAIPPALFETHANWKFGNHDPAAACCRFGIWIFMMILGTFFNLAIFGLIGAGVLLLLAIVVLGSAGGGGGGDCNCDCCKCEACDFKCCSTKYCIWGFSLCSCACPGSLATGDLCTRRKSYKEYLDKGVRYEKVPKTRQQVPGAGVLEHEEADTVDNVIACYTCFFKCCSRDTCPCIYTEFMNPQY